MNIGIIGSGSWSVALATLLEHPSRQIYWWMRNEKSTNFFKQYRRQKDHLSHVLFNPKAHLLATSDIVEVFQKCDTILLVLPSAFLLQAIEHIDKSLWKNKIIISAIKGLVTDQHQLINVYLQEKFQVDNDHYVAITGPSHAEEVVQKKITYLTIAGSNATLSERIAHLFRHPFTQLRHTPHVNSAQYAGVLKNVYAIASGIAHGLEYGDNFQSVININAAKEMCNILQTICPHEAIEQDTFLSSPYLGDLLVTSYSIHSRNHKLGELLTKGHCAKYVIEEMKIIAEGYYALKWLVDEFPSDGLSQFPIINTLSKIVFKNNVNNIEKDFSELLGELR